MGQKTACRFLKVFYSSRPPARHRAKRATAKHIVWRLHNGSNTLCRSAPSNGLGASVAVVSKPSLPGDLSTTPDRDRRYARVRRPQLAALGEPEAAGCKNCS